LEDQIQTISSYAILSSKKFSHGSILALVLPKDFESGNMKDFKNPAFVDEKINLAMDMDLSTTVADIASSNILDDRMKMPYIGRILILHNVTMAYQISFQMDLMLQLIIAF